MSDSQLHQQIGELVADVRAIKEDLENSRERFNQIEKQLQCIDRKVTEHRTVGRLGVGIGGVLLTVFGIVVGYLARVGWPVH